MSGLNWEYFKLSELATFRRGSFPQPYGLDKWYDDENGFPFVQVFDVGDNMKLKNTTKRKISSLAGEQSVFVEIGTIILTIQGSIGRIAITHYDTYIDRTLLIFQTFKLPTDKIFFMYVVHRLFEDEKKRAHGSTIATITKEQLSSFVIPLPPLEEQQKIAEILKTVDAKIEVIDQQITETQELKKGLMQRLLTKGIGHTEFKDSPLGMIPESWEVVKLGDIAKITSGATPNRDVEDYWGGNIPWITTSLIKFNYISTCDEFITKLAIENSSVKLFPKGTILMAMYGQGVTRGKVAVLNIEATTNQACCAIIIDSKIINNFIFYQLQSLYDKLRSLSNAGGQENLSGGIIKSILMKVPSIEEQQKIADILCSVDEKLEVLAEKKANYQELKQGLMQKLLTGKIRVKV